MITSIVVLDHAIEQALYAIRNPHIVQAFIWISELASETTIIGLTAVAIILLVRRRKWPAISGLIISVLGSTAVVLVLKYLVARVRPAGIAAYQESGFSFPSWHATSVVAFYGFILFLMWEALTPLQRKIKLAAVGIIILAVGFSRLYLGVHYPSDVLAGYLLGGLFVWLGIIVARNLEQKPTSSQE